MSDRLLQLVERVIAPPAPIGDRGALLYVDDVVQLLGGKKSAWWVRHHFAPEYKRKIGSTCAWWKRDALFWIDATIEAA